MEDNFSPEESIRAIQAMIEKAKDHFSENGHLYLLWGWVVLICSLGEFVLVQAGVEGHQMVWFLTWAAVIYQFIYLRKQQGREKVKTYAGSMIGYVWLAFFILMVLLAFFLFRGNEKANHVLLYPVFLALYGMPTFLCGALLKFRPLLYGGIGCWLLSVLSVYISPEYQLLLISVAMVIAWIVPGYLLRKKYQKQFVGYGG
jgi:FtsH-binding integral membrane protein